MRLHLVLGVLCWLSCRSSLLVSTLLYETPAYVEDAIQNLVAFTLATTEIIVHLSPSSTYVHNESKWARVSRLHMNREPANTCSACGTVTRQHAWNVRYAREVLKLDFSHVAVFASTCRLFAGGGYLERHVTTHNFSSASEPGWAQTALLGCENVHATPRAARSACHSHFSSSPSGLAIARVRDAGDGREMIASPTRAEKSAARPRETRL